MNKNELLTEIDKVYSLHSDNLRKEILSHQEIVILGNGGSNSIASHIAQDYTKQLNKRAYTFSDPSRLTCYINDYGMAEANRQFVKEFAGLHSLVIVISSSGNSENMCRVVQYCQENNIDYITLTGFDSNNKIRKMNKNGAWKPKVDVWVQSEDYGIVECVHQIALHCVLGDIE